MTYASRLRRASSTSHLQIWLIFAVIYTNSDPLHCLQCPTRRVYSTFLRTTILHYRILHLQVPAVVCNGSSSAFNRTSLANDLLPHYHRLVNFSTSNGRSFSTEIGFQAISINYSFDSCNPVV